MMLLRKFRDRRQLADMAHGLYSAAVLQSRRAEFYTEMGVPDSVDGRFDLLTLHMFLLLHRLGHGGAEVKPLSQAVFDLMFADMDRNLREMGVSDTGVGRRIKNMAQAFYGRIGAYEPALEDAGALKEALLRNLYRGADPGPCLAVMAAYVQREASALAAQRLEDLKEGRVSFGDPVRP